MHIMSIMMLIRIERWEKNTRVRFNTKERGNQNIIEIPYYSNEWVIHIFDFWYRISL
jgi:hypothetical protein